MGRLYPDSGRKRGSGNDGGGGMRRPGWAETDARTWSDNGGYADRKAVAASSSTLWTTRPLSAVGRNRMTLAAPRLAKALPDGPPGARPCSGRTR